MDPGDRQDPAPVERAQGDRDQAADRREQDRAVQRLGRLVVRAPGGGGPECEGEPPGCGVTGQHVHGGALREGHLSAQVGAPAEAVESEPPARRQRGPQQSAVADDARAQQRCRRDVVQAVGQPVREGP